MREAVGVQNGATSVAVQYLVGDQCDDEIFVKCTIAGLLDTLSWSEAHVSSTHTAAATAAAADV